MGPVRLFMGHPGPPPPPRIAQHFSALLWGLTALKFSFTWVWHKAPPGPPKYEKRCYFFSYFGVNLKNFLADCFPISYVHIYGWEKLVFKLFPLVVHMSPLWWGLRLLTFWCPCCPWILCKGPTWPRKKLN